MRYLLLLQILCFFAFGIFAGHSYSEKVKFEYKLMNMTLKQLSEIQVIKVEL